MNKQLAFIGLGVMGYPMAAHLVNKSGCPVKVYNRTSSKAEKWVSEFGGELAISPHEATQDSDYIFICVGNDDDLKEVIYGSKGVFHAIKPGAVIVDHTTVSAKVTRELSAMALEKGCHFIDAPVSGGQAGAENGQLTIMCGGDKEAFEAIEPVCRQCYAREIKYLGESGSGQIAKMVNQICIAGLLQGLSEGLAFGLRAGLDMDHVIDAISKGAAGSWQMDNRARTMISDSFDFGFAVDWMVKDLEIALDEARRNGASLEQTAQVLGYYRELQEEGGGRLDTSSLIRRLFSFP
jgi:3-hydroxyisobutyrate dehydrogenase-like beta-hydroxyacid dehydrogenase